MFFELKERVLYFYDERPSDLSSFPSGYLFLMDGCVVSSSNGADDVAMASSLRCGVEEPTFAFAIAHPKSHKAFSLAASTKQDSQRWIDAIRAECTKPFLPSKTSLPSLAMASSSSDNNNNNTASINVNASSPKLAITKFNPRKSSDFGVPSMFAKKTDAAVSLFCSLTSNPELWTFYNEKDLVKTYEQNTSSLPGLPTESAASIFGALGQYSIIDAPARCIFELAWTSGARGQVDPQLESWSVVEELGPQTRVDHVSYAAIWPTSKRDFCRLSHYQVDESTGSILIVSVSVEHLMCPQQRDAVRAHLYCTGFLIVPLNETSCRVTYLIVVDPIISSVPRRFVVSVSASQTMILQKIASYFEHPDREDLKAITLERGPVINERDANTSSISIPPTIAGHVRRRKRSTGGLTFLKNDTFSTSSLTLSAKPQVINVSIFARQFNRNLFFMCIAFAAMLNWLLAAGMFSHLDVTDVQKVALFVNSCCWTCLMLFFWGESSTSFINGRIRLGILNPQPGSPIDKRIIIDALRCALAECPSMNGSFSLMGKWVPSDVVGVAVLNEPWSETATVFSSSTSRERSNRYAVLFVTCGLAEDHARWTKKPVLVSLFDDSLMVSCDKRCARDLVKFCEFVSASLRNVSLPTSPVHPSAAV